MKVLHHRLGLLFKEKENSVQGSLANKWLTKEAAAVDSIIKAGTFRYDRQCFIIFANKFRKHLKYLEFKQHYPLDYFKELSPILTLAQCCGTEVVFCLLLSIRYNYCLL